MPSSSCIEFKHVKYLKFPFKKKKHVKLFHLPGLTNQVKNHIYDCVWFLRPIISDRCKLILNFNIIIILYIFKKVAYQLCYPYFTGVILTTKYFFITSKY